MKCIIWILEDQPPPSCVLDLIGHRHAHSQEGCDVCVWCVGLKWERLRMGSGLKARLIGVSKKDKHTGLSELLRRCDIDIRPHTYSEVQVALSSCNKWERQKPILILNEQLYPDDGVGIASLLETFSLSCFPRISKIFHRSLKRFRLNRLAIICHGDNSL